MTEYPDVAGATRSATIERDLLPLDADARARVLEIRETRLHRAGVDERARAFREAVVAGDLKLASKLFLAEPGHTERVAFIRECEGTELHPLVRLNGVIASAILAAHPDPGALKRELIDPATLPRLVSITRAKVGVDKLAVVSATTTSTGYVTPEQAKRLTELGAKVLPEYDPRTGTQLFRYCGWVPSDAMRRASPNAPPISDAISEGCFLEMLKVDKELCSFIRDGRLVVETITSRGSKVEDAPELAALKRV